MFWKSRLLTLIGEKRESANNKQTKTRLEESELIKLTHYRKFD
jgi:hypothetical protein